MKKYAVLSLSGGMDSSTLLLHLLANGYEVTALSFDYGQKHKVELERAVSLVEYLNGCSQKTEQDQLRTITVTGENFPLIKHQIIKIDGLGQLLNSTLVEGGTDVPEGHYAEANMKDTVVPNRNKIFSSIIQAVALSIADKNSAECSIALGTHSGDHQIYPDCTSAFRDADYVAFCIGNWGAEKVHFYTPYMEGDKFTILQDGEKCCDQLGLDFNEVYKRTNTSYKPYPSGNSDYKSASSVERVEAFIKLGRPDPVIYEDEDGIASWEKVVLHVEQILNQHKN
jgi:7-cyano-7-deazaguanine synthase